MTAEAFSEASFGSRPPDFAPSSETLGGCVGPGCPRKRCLSLAYGVAHSLEGSRFYAWQLYRPAAGGSRARPLMCLSYRFSNPIAKTSVPWLALGTFAGAACCQTTDLPPYKAAPLQAQRPRQDLDQNNAFRGRRRRRVRLAARPNPRRYAQTPTRPYASSTLPAREASKKSCRRALGHNHAEHTQYRPQSADICPIA